jgi:heme-degrading monooxygenase HmoA
VQTLKRYTRQLRSFSVNGRSLPIVIVLDNVDVATPEYQRLVFGLAQQLARHALVVVCLREDTYAEGREPGGFLTASALQFVFHVRSPPFDRLLRARIAFARRCVANPRSVPDKLRAVVRAPSKLNDFLTSIETILLRQKSEALEILAALAGHNMREGFGLVRGIATGDIACNRRRETSAAYALECLFAARNFTEATSVLHLANLYDAEPANIPAHGLRIRLLAYFWWARESQASRSINERTETVISRFASLGYATGEVERALIELVRLRTVLPADRGEARGRATSLELAPRLSLTASGYVHLRRLQPLSTYRAAMALTTRWYTEEDLKTFVQQAESAAGAGGLTIADIAASAALKTFTAYLMRSWSNEDGMLASPIRQQHEWAREIDSRCGLTRVRSDPPASGSKARVRKPSETGQRALFDAAPRPDGVDLRPLPADSNWLSRLLWALEFARRSQLPPQSATDLAQILNDHGEQSVFANNVARAFRDFKKQKRHQEYWRMSGKRYVITPAGGAELEAMIAAIDER